MKKQIDLIAHQISLLFGNKKLIKKRKGNNLLSRKKKKGKNK